MKKKQCKSGKAKHIFILLENLFHHRNDSPTIIIFQLLLHLLIVRISVTKKIIVNFAIILKLFIPDIGKSLILKKQ